MRTALFVAVLVVVLFRVLPFESVAGMAGQGSSIRVPEQGGLLETIDGLGGFKVVVAAAISVPVLIASLVAIFRKGDPDAQKWAFGAVGTLLGFWLSR